MIGIWIDVNSIYMYTYYRGQRTISQAPAVSV